MLLQVLFSALIDQQTWEWKASLISRVRAGSDTSPSSLFPHLFSFSFFFRILSLLFLLLLSIIPVSFSSLFSYLSMSPFSSSVYLFCLSCFFFLYCFYFLGIIFIISLFVSLHLSIFSFSYSYFIFSLSSSFCLFHFYIFLFLFFLSFLLLVLILLSISFFLFFVRTSIWNVFSVMSSLTTKLGCLLYSKHIQNSLSFAPTIRFTQSKVFNIGRFLP